MGKFVSVLLVFLLLASVVVPVVNAEPVPFAGAAVVAAPAAAKLVIDGITVILTSAVIIELGKNIGKTWDGIEEHWDKFAKGVSKGLENIFHAKEWIKVTSPKGKAIMKVVYELYAAGGSSGGKDDKWYFEARIHDHQIEINPKRLNEEQALKEMGRGKHIMTLNEELVKNAVARFKGLSKKEVDRMAFEGTHNPATGYFKHLHYEAQDMRLHCWSWK